jgi:hypothetical protein
MKRSEVPPMATKLEDKIDPAALYEADFYAWARHQADTLRQFQATRPNLSLDFEHLIEEVEDLARRDVRAAKSQLRRLILHALKLEFSPADRPRRQWLNSLDDARHELDDVLSPSVVAIVTPLLGQLFEEARTAALRDLLDADGPETVAAMPEALPYTLDQLTDKAWYPANRHGLVNDTL